MSRNAPRQERIHRRKFLRTTASLTAAPILAARAAPAAAFGQDSKLAVDGGTPVRATPLHARPCGPQFHGEEENKEILDVLESRSPFRWWGSGSSPPPKVRAFEEEYAGHLGVKYAVGVTSGTTALITAMAAMSAEGVPASPPSGSAILPVEPHIMEKATVHPAGPSFQTAEGKAVRYGPETCPRTLDILGRHAGVIMDPNFSDEDVKDIVKAVRKVHSAIV